MKLERQFFFKFCINPQDSDLQRALEESLVSSNNSARKRCWSPDTIGSPEHRYSSGSSSVTGHPASNILGSLEYSYRSSSSAVTGHSASNILGFLKHRCRSSSSAVTGHPTSDILGSPRTRVQF